MRLLLLKRPKMQEQTSRPNCFTWEYSEAEGTAMILRAAAKEIKEDEWEAWVVRYVGKRGWLGCSCRPRKPPSRQKKAGWDTQL